MRKKNVKNHYAEFNELLTRVLRDTAPKKIADSAYLFGENPDNEAMSFRAARDLWRTGKTKTIAIDDLGKRYGYSGFSQWRKKLVAQGIPQKNIHRIPLAPDFPSSTHAEALGIVRYAKKKKWSMVYVVAPPVHMLRAFVTVVSAAIREKSKLKIYSFPAVAERWEDRVTYSQETWKGRRSELLSVELKKISRYYKKGDLVSAGEVLEYLDKRDRAK